LDRPSTEHHQSMTIADVDAQLRSPRLPEQLV
jgi:hypothetical protein